MLVNTPAIRLLGKAALFVASTACASRRSRVASMSGKAREHYGAADSDERETGNHEAHACK
jgi:hypothetical protein